MDGCPGWSFKLPPAYLHLYLFISLSFLLCAPQHCSYCFWHPGQVTPPLLYITPSPKCTSTLKLSTASIPGGVLYCASSRWHTYQSSTFQFHILLLPPIFSPLLNECVQPSAKTSKQLCCSPYTTGLWALMFSGVFAYPHHSMTAAPSSSKAHPP